MCNARPLTKHSFLRMMLSPKAGFTLVTPRLDNLIGPRVVFFFFAVFGDIISAARFNQAQYADIPLVRIFGTCPYQGPVVKTTGGNLAARASSCYLLMLVFMSKRISPADKWKAACSSCTIFTTNVLWLLWLICRPPCREIMPDGLIQKQIQDGAGCTRSRPNQFLISLTRSHLQLLLDLRRTTPRFTRRALLVFCS